MEPPLLDTSMLLEKRRDGLVTGGKVSSFVGEYGIDEIEWCDIHTGCNGPWWCCPCQSVTKCIGGIFECTCRTISCEFCTDDSPSIH